MTTSANWPLLEAENVSVTFPVSDGLMGTKRKVHAVNDVTLKIHVGETLGLVGESGSGKSTLGRALLQLERMTAGEVRFDGHRITHGLKSDVTRLRLQTAMIFQDPYASLNPRQTIGYSIAEVLRVHQKVPRNAVNARVAELLTLVGLRPEQARVRPEQLSGGQCQRAGIARALAIEPRLIVADECVAALDVSIQGQIVNLLMELREKMGLAILFIAHDLAIVRRLCDRVARTAPRSTRSNRHKTLITGCFPMSLIRWCGWIKPAPNWSRAWRKAGPFRRTVKSIPLKFVTPNSLTVRR